MCAAEALEKVLQMYGQYYQVKRDEVAPPFAAEAESSVVDELLSGFKTVKISSAESREIVFFTAEEELTADLAQRLAETWAEGYNLGRQVMQLPNRVFAVTLKPRAAALYAVMLPAVPKDMRDRMVLR